MKFFAISVTIGRSKGLFFDGSAMSACRCRSPDSSADVVIRANFVVEEGEERGGMQLSESFSGLFLLLGKGLPTFNPQMTEMY